MCERTVAADGEACGRRRACIALPLGGGWSQDTATAVGVRQAYINSGQQGQRRGAP